MRSRCLAAALFALVFCTAASAVAQETGQVGLTMGYPTTIGIIWHVSDTAALRPEFSYAHNSGETSSPAAGVLATSSGNSTGVGLSALFYVRKWDSVGAYITPRYFYSHSSTTSEAMGAPVNGSSTTTNSGHSVTGSVGVQYSVNRRFGVFGEAGFGYTHGKGSSTSSSSEVRTNLWAMRGAIGAILYF